MKNIKRWIACFLMLALCLMAGCAQTDSAAGDNDEIVLAKLTVGLPIDESDEGWGALQKLLEDFEFMDDADVTIVKVPEVGTDEYTSFINDVSKNRIDLFVSPSNDEIEQLIDDGVIMSVTRMNSKNNQILNSMIDVFRKVSLEKSGVNYMIPTNIKYQGLFLNTDVFESAGVAVPTDWATLQSAIADLNAKGVTPFAAGFADGASYWIDEIILAEGGAAEHSALPAKGVINSWQRAIDDLVAFYNANAFGPNALSATHADAVFQFKDKQAAMILADSTDLADADDTVSFMPFPASPTGIKKQGEMIAQATLGFYVNTKSMNAAVDDVTSMAGVIGDFVGADYMSNPEYYEALFYQAGTLPASKTVSDVLKSEADKAAMTALSNAPDADEPLANRMLTFDNLEKGIADVLRGNTKSADYLLAASTAEIAAQSEKRKAERES